MNDRTPRGQGYLSRRQMLQQSGAGFGALALQAMLSRSLLGDNDARPKPHHPPLAKNAIFLFMEGGPSHLESFDWDPEAADLRNFGLDPEVDPARDALDDYAISNC